MSLLTELGTLGATACYKQVAPPQNVAQVALEAGNSAKMILSNYRELVKPAQAAKWFAIAPERPANIIQVPTPAAASVEAAAATA